MDDSTGFGRPTGLGICCVQVQYIWFKLTLFSIDIEH